MAQHDRHGLGPRMGNLADPLDALQDIGAYEDFLQQEGGMHNEAKKGSNKDTINGYLWMHRQKNTNLYVTNVTVTISKT